MKSLKQLCVPRDSVFDASKRDTVLNLSHLTNGQIDAKSFFDENYATEGMKTLLTESFRRLAGKSEQAVFKLTQAMGGGKTHNLITLGLLAQHPEFRAGVLAGLPDATALPAVRAVFSGRETDVPHRGLGRDRPANRVRLMRIIAARLWKGGEADKRFLVSVHDVDLNDPDTLSEIRQINSTLENAVSHDIAGEGRAVAEIMDQNLGGADARDATRLIFMASLGNVPNAVLGLSMPAGDG